MPERRQADQRSSNSAEAGAVSAEFLTLEKVIFLKSVGMFSEIPEESLVEVANAVEEMEVERGEAIFRQGEFGTSMYIVVEGKVVVREQEHDLGELGEREVFGELAALDPVPRSATVTAAVDSYLFRVDQSVLYDLMTRHVDVARGVIKVLCKRIRDCDALIGELSGSQKAEAKARN